MTERVSLHFMFSSVFPLIHFLFQDPISYSEILLTQDFGFRLHKVCFFKLLSTFSFSKENFPMSMASNLNPFCMSRLISQGFLTGKTVTVFCPPQPPCSLQVRVK